MPQRSSVFELAVSRTLNSVITRKTVDVELSADEAIALVEASFDADRGWRVERDQLRVRAYPADAGDYLLEPPPKLQPRRYLPETLAVQVDAAPLPDGGARVRARITRYRHRVVGLIGVVLLDVLAAPFGSFAFESIAHGMAMVSLRRNRRGAKRRMLRLAIEPLVPYQREWDRGPFRRGWQLNSSA